MTFEVHGPSGYVNRKVAQVNTGRPRPDEFAELAPNAAFDKSFELTRLHSMHVPGEYSVWLHGSEGVVELDVAIDDV